MSGAIYLQRIWEEAARQSPCGRALTMLRLATPDASAAELATLPIGERDRRLLAIREALAGSHIEAAASCPACGERVEMSFTAAELREHAPKAASSCVSVEKSGYRVDVRLPTTADLIEVTSAASPGKAAQMLLERCIVHQTPPGPLPPEVINAVGESVANADPMADIRVSSRCPACAHTWELPFDITSFLWQEVDDRARRLLREVHVLARHYGWSESAILEMSDFRRRCYLEMLGEQ